MRTHVLLRSAVRSWNRGAWRCFWRLLMDETSLKTDLSGKDFWVGGRVRWDKSDKSGEAALWGRCLILGKRTLQNRNRHVWLESTGRVRKAGARWHGGVRSRTSVPGTGVALPYRAAGTSSVSPSVQWYMLLFFPLLLTPSCPQALLLPSFPSPGCRLASSGRLQVITRNQQKGRKMLLSFAPLSCQFCWLAKPVFLFGNRLSFSFG